MPKSSFGKKIIVKNPEIKQNLDNKDYQVKKEKRKKLNDSNKVNPNNNTNHLNHLNSLFYMNLNQSIYLIIHLLF